MSKPDKEQSISFAKRISIWLLLLCFLSFLPSILVYFAIGQYFSVKARENILQFKKEQTYIREITAEAIDKEVYAVKHLYKELIKLTQTKNINTSIIEDWLINQKRIFFDEIDYMIFGVNRNLIKSTYKNPYGSKEWSKVVEELLHYAPLFAQGQFHRTAFTTYKQDLDIHLKYSRKVLGPQLVDNSFDGLWDSRVTSLVWGDSALIKDPFAVYTLENCMVFLFFKPEFFKDISTVKIVLHNYLANNKNTNIKIGLYDIYQKKMWSPEGASLIADPKTIEEMESRNEENKEFPDSFLIYKYLSPRYRLLTSIKKLFSLEEIQKYSLMGSFICIILTIPFMIYSYRTAVQGKPGKASIRTKLIFLLCFATGIPIIAMITTWQKNYQNLGSILPVNALNTAREAIKTYDDNYKLFLTKKSMDFKNFIGKFTEKIKTKGFTPELNREIWLSMNKKFAVNEMYIVASDTNQIGAKVGYITFLPNDKKLKIDYTKSFSINLEPIRNNIFGRGVKDVHIIIKVAKLAIWALNNPNKELKIGDSNLALIAESILKLNLEEIVNEIIANAEDIHSWQFGKRNGEFYFSFVNLFDLDLCDYAVIAMWEPGKLQIDYVNSSLGNFNRNPEGVELVLHNIIEDTLYGNLSTNTEKYSKIMNYIKEAGNSISPEFKSITFGNRSYNMVGINGKKLKNYNIIALYPDNKIKNNLEPEKINLFMYIFISIILSLGIAQILSRSFLEPLKELRLGAEALEKRDYAHRVINNDKDEFAEVSNIFNRMMVGLAEVETAKVVQGSLFPKEHFEQNDFKIFGRNVAMSGIGGDYFDYYAIDESRFATLVGDVAGHGVAAAVIVAMAKAGILVNTDQQDSPKIIMNSLHDIILKSKSKKQRKIMTCQYMVCNSNTGEALYSNAGACSPYFYRKATGEIEELKFVAPVLGAFKRTVYQETSVQFQPGDALVFYTDGMVESRNVQGFEITYAGLQNLIKKSYNTDPEVFYNNMYSAYEKYIEGAETQDDITIVIVMYLPKTNSANNTDPETMMSADSKEA